MIRSMVIDVLSTTYVVLHPPLRHRLVRNTQKSAVFGGRLPILLFTVPSALENRQSDLRRLIMKATVYFSRTITPEKVLELYKRVGKELPGNVAIKVDKVQ